MKLDIPESNIENTQQWSGSVFFDKELVLTCHTNTKDIPVRSEPRRMNFIFIGLCTRGQAEYTLDTRKLTIGPNDLIMVTERTVINDYKATDDTEGLSICMSMNFFREIFSNVSDLSSALLFARDYPIIKLPLADSTVFRRYFYAIYNRVSDKENRFRRPLARTLLLAMFYDLSNVITQVLHNGKQPQKRSDIVFTRFISMVEANCRKERRVSWYAQQIGITPKYLSETVKSASHRTPNEWIENYVVTELQVMLRNSTKSIKTIAEEMNFPNQSFLGKYFKERVGMSPSEYRK